MKLFSYVSGLVLGFLFVVQPVAAQQIATLDFFHGRECPHCQTEKAWFPDLKKAYPDLVINEYEVWHNAENQALWTQRMAELDMEPSGVPTNIIGDKVIVGFKPEALLATLELAYGPPAVVLASAEKPSDETPADYTWLLIVLGGLGLAGMLAWFGKKS